MMSKQETAVEWFSEMIVDMIHESHHSELADLYESAKEMEKEQIINTFKESQVLVVLDDTKRAEQFYNETYESKESDDHIGDANKMVTAVQKLIDKDIFNQAILAMEEMYGSGCDAEIDAYFRGAKWMRQELNKQI